MGFFTNIGGGHGKCLRCAQRSRIEFQTKLFHADAANSCRTYLPGDIVRVDSLDDFAPLYDWDRAGLLVVVFGDWDCDHCRFNYQSAKVTFDVLAENPPEMAASIVDVEQFIPIDEDSFGGVHYIEEELALILDGMDKRQALAPHPKGQLEEFRALSAKEKISRMLRGEAMWAEYHGLDLAGEIRSEGG